MTDLHYTGQHYVHIDDLNHVCSYVEDRGYEALKLLAGWERDTHEGFGPRLWLRYRDKKRIEQLLGELVHEAGLLRRFVADHVAEQ